MLLAQHAAIQSHFICNDYICSAFSICSQFSNYITCVLACLLALLLCDYLTVVSFLYRHQMLMLKLGKLLRLVC